MDVIAVFTVTSPDGTITHASQQRFTHIEKTAEENKMLRAIQKTKKDLEKAHKLEFENKKVGFYSNSCTKAHDAEKPTKDKLSVVFETVESEIVLDPTKIHQTEKRQILARIGKLPIDDLRTIDLIYC
jgi:hypothetical protein